MSIDGLTSNHTSLMPPIRNQLTTLTRYYHASYQNSYTRLLALGHERRPVEHCSTHREPVRVLLIVSHEPSTLHSCPTSLCLTPYSGYHAMPQSGSAT